MFTVANRRLLKRFLKSGILWRNRTQPLIIAPNAATALMMHVNERFRTSALNFEDAPWWIWASEYDSVTSARWNGWCEACTICQAHDTSISAEHFTCLIFQLPLASKRRLTGCMFWNVPTCFSDLRAACKRLPSPEPGAFSASRRGEKCISKVAFESKCLP